MFGMGGSEIEEIIINLNKEYGFWDAVFFNF
jgi:hypothetical protein